VVDADTGDVVLGSAHPQQVGAPLGDPSDTRFKHRVAGWSDAGQIDLDGRQAAYKRIASTTGNANHWYVVSIADAPTGPLTGGGAQPVAVASVALLLIAYLLPALRRGQTVLVNAANTDPLTGLYNRRRLVVDLDGQLARATIDDPLLLIMCDLNGFKTYNDTF